MRLKSYINKEQNRIKNYPYIAEDTFDGEVILWLKAGTGVTLINGNAQNRPVGCLTSTAEGATILTLKTVTIGNQEL